MTYELCRAETAVDALVNPVRVDDDPPGLAVLVPGAVYIKSWHWLRDLLGS